MKSYDEFFLYPGQPAGEDRISEIERGVGRRLPDDYRALIRETGGGSLKLDRCVMPGLPDGAGRLATEDIFGNGKTSNGANVDLVDFALFLMDEWEIPDEVLLFATTEDGMHNCFVINYDLPDHPVGSVLHLDTDPGGKMTRVADSVTDFLDKLEPYSEGDDEGYDPSAGQEGMGIKGVWHGGLSDDLPRAIAATPTPDLEYLLRKAAAPLANSFNLNMMHNSPEGQRFQDILYWAAQHVQPHPDALSYMDLNSERLEPNLRTLMDGSFIASGQRYGFIWNEATVGYWWKIRVQHHILRETPSGYILNEDYIMQVLKELRDEGAAAEC